MTKSEYLESLIFNKDVNMDQFLKEIEMFVNLDEKSDTAEDPLNYLAVIFMKYCMSMEIEDVASTVSFTVNERKHNLNCDKDFQSKLLELGKSAYLKGKEADKDDEAALDKYVAGMDAYYWGETQYSPEERALITDHQFVCFMMGQFKFPKPLLALYLVTNGFQKDKMEAFEKLQKALKDGAEDDQSHSSEL